MAKRKKITKPELTQLTSRADSVSTLPSRFGTYDAIVWINGKVLRVTTESLNPTGDVTVEEITEAAADKLMAQ